MFFTLTSSAETVGKWRLKWSLQGKVSQMNLTLFYSLYSAIKKKCITIYFLSCMRSHWVDSVFINVSPWKTWRCAVLVYVKRLHSTKDNVKLSSKTWGGSPFSDARHGKHDWLWCGVFAGPDERHKPLPVFSRQGIHTRLRSEQRWRNPTLCNLGHRLSYIHSFSKDPGDIFWITN